MFMPPVGNYNPYIAGRVVGQNRGFFDREHILEAVERTLSSPNQNVIILHGQRRIGKSSILRRLRHNLPSQRFLPVFVDLMHYVRLPLGQMLGEIALEIIAAVKERAQQNETLGEIASGSATAPEWDTLKPEQFDDQGDYFRTTFLPMLYAKLGEHCDPVLLLDEFDVLDQPIEQQTSVNAVARTFFPYLHELLERDLRLKCVFSIGRRIEELSINKAAFKSWPSQRVSVFDHSSARYLITLAERFGTLAFDPAAIDLILQLAAGHPYLTQLLCQILWDNAHADQPSAVPFIDIAAVEVAAASSLNAGKNAFEWIWAELPPAERLILAAIAVATDQRSGVTEQQLLPWLQVHSRYIKMRDMEVALRTLIEREMLRQTNDVYQFHVELVRQWVAMHEPLSKVRDDIDRVLPLADQHYQTANAYYTRFDLENAQDELRKALRTNPNHAQAHVLLGQILRELGKLPEAIDELEQAYRYGEREARDLLIRALISRGNQLENEDPNAALNIYARTLEISPRETQALNSFDKILKQQQEVKIATYEQKQQWDAAIKICQNLAAQFPNEKIWRREIRRLEGKRRDDQARRQVKRLLDVEQGKATPNLPAQPRSSITASMPNDPTSVPSANPPRKQESSATQSFAFDSKPTNTNAKPQLAQRRRSYSMIWGVITIFVLAGVTFLAYAFALFPRAISATEATASIVSTTVALSTRAPPATALAQATQTAQPFTTLPFTPTIISQTATFTPDLPSPPSSQSADESPTPSPSKIPPATLTSTNTITPTTPVPTTPVPTTPVPTTPVPTTPVPTTPVPTTPVPTTPVPTTPVPTTPVPTTPVPTTPVPTTPVPTTPVPTTPVPTTPVPPTSTMPILSPPTKSETVSTQPKAGNAYALPRLITTAAGSPDDR